MPPKGLFQCNPVKAIHDNYFTRKSAWEDIKEFIPNDKIIWEGFYDAKSKSASHLTDLGFNVISGDFDFFTEDKGDICVSNPSFSLKKETFTRLKELNKPFILLVPSTCLHTKYFTELFKDEKIQLIIPATKRHFDKLGNDGEFVKMKDNCSFYTLYVCWQMNLEKDVIFIK